MGCCLFVYYRRKRKQASRDADALSLCSLDNNKPNTKRRVASLASLLPPVKVTSLKRISQTLQRSISCRHEGRVERAAPPPRPPPPCHPPSLSMVKTRVISATISNPSSRVSTLTAVASKRRDSKLWSETFDIRAGATQTLSPKEIKRQEAIFELAQGEQDLVEDLKLARKAYRDPMLKLSIMTEQELNQIFGTLDSLIPLHEDLLSRLRDARKPDGSTENVGPILTGWLPCLSSYTPYCSNQVQAKALLDQKKQDPRVQDFLQRCLQSPFSRKLDLWNFLDIPRSRLVKYPLLLREILKHTDNDHPDRQHLEEAMLMVQTVVADINRQTGESECQYYKDCLLYSEDGQRDELIDRSKCLSCHGELKNNRGLKLHVFLFQDILVITRSMSLNNQPVSYQLCRQPIPIQQLDLEDISDGEMRVGGSIRGAFSNNERTKNFFRVSYRSGSQLQTHCFQASDAFNKQQWINCIRQAKEAAAAAPTAEQNPHGGQRLHPEQGRLMELSHHTGPSPESGHPETKAPAKMEEVLELQQEDVLNGGEDLGLSKETTTMMEEQVPSEGGEVDSSERKGLPSGRSLTGGETETRRGPESPADWKMEEEAETPSSADKEVPASVLVHPVNPEQEESMKEEEHGGSKEEEGVDTGGGEEASHRC
ncbi:PREDICTED: rho guanine nucleotide exchange factor 3 isoform X1 [Cyprinodon variegatus]|uniref:Rho guanine nucleotide exchange factor (GEF) 3 n=1 Tax=Cyprinodon variegatus TaxID=28743 RepID=A0A3Q2D841_CYPVA|nr:PREDICTED: rho guanine nucleotide exchange factor 3 isoform X1 [Cyprinodon variegatus]